MASAKNLPDANIRTYSSFVGALKWVIPVAAIIGLTVIFLIS